MTMRRLLTALGALLAATIAFAPGAHAAPAYPPVVNGGLVIPADIDVGEIHVIIGVGFRPGIQVTVTVSREDRNGDPNTRGFAGAASANVLGPFAATRKAAADSVPQGWKGHLTMACARAASCSVNADASGQVSFPIHFFNSHTHVLTVTGVHPDGSPRVLQEVIVPETDCDERDGEETEVADSGLVPDCDQAGGVGGSGSNNGGGSASGQLPNTGASVGLPITAGAVLVLLGAGLVTVFRRRRRGDLTA
jgi:LPXTG-motif cell wall-anchored protein